MGLSHKLRGVRRRVAHVIGRLVDEGSSSVDVAVVGRLARAIGSGVCKRCVGSVSWRMKLNAMIIIGCNVIYIHSYTCSCLFGLIIVAFIIIINVVVFIIVILIFYHHSLSP